MQRDLFAPTVEDVCSNAKLAIRTEAQKRDDALDALERTRARAISIARGFAEQIYARQRTVTSPEVLAAMRNAGHGQLLDSLDRRFMGCVFRNGWEQVGWAKTGSHKRGVPVWRRRETT